MSVAYNAVYNDSLLSQVEKAEQTVAKIDEELKDLQATLANIEEARPFEDLTVRLSCPYWWDEAHDCVGRGRRQRAPANLQEHRHCGLQGQVDRAG